MPVFKINDHVETIDDAIKGIVKKIDGNTITVEDALGFQFNFFDNELIHVSNQKSIEKAVNNTDISSIKAQKKVIKPKLNKAVKPKHRSKAKFEVDLHIHQLCQSTKGMTNFDMLNLQINTAKRQLEFAIKKRIPKMVFIHGVGEGVLKQELTTLLNRYDNLSYYDADFKTYGFGATEVRIFNN